MVLGFPCNQFGAQEPNSNAEILEFAKSTYDVTFPMFSKIDVNGDDAAPLYKFLRESKAAEDGSTDIKWNFEKFLVDGNGVVQKRYATPVTPEQIAQDLESYLGA
jgi:glutathione peroxidase